MKSEFILAFNEICESRGLQKDDVFEALKNALVSAYRRDTNVSNLQAVTADIDPRTGDPTIYAEKEVVDSIIDHRTEVLLAEARKADPNAEYGDLVMVDSTTASFGRIAAQTAKQVLLQRVREAERDQLFDEFSGREGELVNGTVQSISGQHITIGLGRTESILPKSQQVRGERYRAHDKIRVYVLEVRRTNRGPQIFVSRNHRNLLRRLLELEVPEIYNGQVDIKSIAREAGQRSKIAVQALQPGVDPVGACVGMRGVRIQSIVRELNDEKIDVIEWDVNQTTFIAKALSPARVAHVFLEDSPTDGKTAVVIVPDDQLSLAIGREGQNARLAAKLTGWRIDIKSITEAATDSLTRLDHPAVDTAVTQDEEFVAQVEQVLAKKQAGRPITNEDYRHLNRLIAAVEGKLIEVRATKYEEVRHQQKEARRNIPEAAKQLVLDELDLPGRIHNLLLDNEIETVFDVLYTLAMGDQAFLEFRGFGDKALETLKEHVANYDLPMPEVEEVEEVEAVVAEEEQIVEEEETAVTEVEEVVEETAVDEPETETAAEEPTPEPEEEPVDAIDDLSQSLIQIKKTKEKEPKKKPSVVVVKQSKTEPEPTDDSKSIGKKGRQLVYNEDAGEVIVKRKRKGSRRRESWEDFSIEDLD